MNNLNILSYNIQDLPWPIKRKRHYFEKIGKKLNQMLKLDCGPDVVLLQEAFTDNSMALAQESGYPYVVRGECAKRKFLNSGLMILSIHQLEKVGELHFKNASLIEGLTSKGVMAVSLSLPNSRQKAYILNTHMQAYLGSDPIRCKQVDEILSFIAEIKALERNVIFAGDFNFSPEADQSYHHWIKKSNFHQAAEWGLKNSCECSLIQAPITLKSGYLARNTTDLVSGMDHHFFYNPETALNKINPIRIQRTFFELHDDKYLSDHFGYEVLYNITNLSSGAIVAPTHDL